MTMRQWVEQPAPGRTEREAFETAMLEGAEYMRRDGQPELVTTANCLPEMWDMFFDGWKKLHGCYLS